MALHGVIETDRITVGPWFLDGREETVSTCAANIRTNFETFCEQCGHGTELCDRLRPLLAMVRSIELNAKFPGSTCPYRTRATQSVGQSV